MTYLARMFGISLVLTIAVELMAAFLMRWFISLAGKGWGRRGIASGDPQQVRTLLGSRRHMALLVVLVNVLTNPAAVLLCWLGRMYLPPSFSFPLQLLVEAAVVAVEARIYRSFMDKEGWQTGRPVLLAVVANICSWTAGIVCAGRIDFALRLILWIGQA